MAVCRCDARRAICSARWRRTWNRATVGKRSHSTNLCMRSEGRSILANCSLSLCFALLCLASCVCVLVARSPFFSPLSPSSSTMSGEREYSASAVRFHADEDFQPTYTSSSSNYASSSSQLVNRTAIQLSPVAPTPASTTQLNPTSSTSASFTTLLNVFHDAVRMACMCVLCVV